MGNRLSATTAASRPAAPVGSGDRWLRVDVWTTNREFQRYYVRLAFTHVRTVTRTRNPSGALFQRPARQVVTLRLGEASESIAAQPSDTPRC